ncbi:hypothetical protein ABH955_000668 [Bacillus sp. RC240]|uniref:hypothetical protein n=1 Tax=Bacillus sp. RC240 TaxID=3156285 RepID=UPI00383943C1
MFDWLNQNKEWFFSGIGVLGISVIGGILFKKAKDGKRHQSIHSGDNSTNIQGGKNVNVTLGEKNER